MLLLFIDTFSKFFVLFFYGVRILLLLLQNRCGFGSISRCLLIDAVVMDDERSYRGKHCKNGDEDFGVDGV